MNMIPETWRHNKNIEFCDIMGVHSSNINDFLALVIDTGHMHNYYVDMQ